MQRRLQLEDQRLYHLLQEGFYVGGAVERQQVAKRNETQSRQDRASELRIRRAIEAMGSVPADAPELPKATDGNPYTEFDGRIRRLPDGGATMVLEQADFARLVRYIGLVAWPMQVVDTSGELEDRLEAAASVKE